MDSLGRSYMLITSGSLRVKQLNSMMWYTAAQISLKFEISWTLAFPANLFKLQLITSTEQLQYVILMLISQFWQVLVNFHLSRLKGKWNCWLTWKWLKKKPGDFTYPRLFFPQAWCLFLIFWGWRKCFVSKLCCKGQHPPWCYPILFGLCCYY